MKFLEAFLAVVLAVGACCLAAFVMVCLVILAYCVLAG